jgi:hypothetical protein
VVERPLHGAQQLLALEGLEEIVVGAAAHGVDGHTDVVDGGDHDDGKIGLESVNALEQGDAVDILHHDVGEHQVEGVEFESFEGFAASVASSMVYPWRSSAAAIMVRTGDSSSTTRMRTGLRGLAQR